MLDESGKAEPWGLGAESGIRRFGRIIRRRELLLGLRRDRQRFHRVAARGGAVRREAVRAIGTVLVRMRMAGRVLRLKPCVSVGRAGTRGNRRREQRNRRHQHHQPTHFVHQAHS